jgi:thioredoxin-dependent peroxiredoxin
VSDMPEIGKRAPVFELPSSEGGTIALSRLKGSPVVLYFYPKDSTPGCTTEALEFRSKIKQFEALGVHIFGISPDSVDSHCKFIDKQKLNFVLLADEGHTVAEKYGVWVEKSMYGKKFMGVQRATFMIDGSGKIAHVWPKVSPKGHAAEVLERARSLFGS